MNANNTTFSDTKDASIRGANSVRRISLYFSERKLLLTFMDALLLNSALVVTLFLRPELAPSPYMLLEHWMWFLSLTGIWFACATSLESYNLALAANPRRSIKRAGTAALLTTVIYALIPYITPALPTSRLVVLVFPLLAILAISMWRLFYATVFVSPSFQQRALIVGAGKAEQKLAEIIERMSYRKGKPYKSAGYRVLGFIEDDNLRPALPLQGLSVLGEPSDLVELVRMLNVDELIIADELIGEISHAQASPSQPQRRRSDIRNATLFAAIMECRELGISITTVATLYERLTGRVPVEYIERAFNMAVPLSQPSTHRFYLVLRRIFDVAVSLVGCVLLVLILPVIWLANRIWSPGPLFYTQERVGKGGRVFDVFKFRSMVVNAEQYSGMTWASEDDPRITPIGRWLRKTRLDEFPQFWNILKGDMSLIGPRPERPFFVHMLAQEIPFYRMRHAVKPGLTGWAQARYRYGASVEDSLMKLQYDLFYIKHQGIMLDIQVVLCTIPVILGFKGR